MKKINLKDLEKSYGVESFSSDFANSLEKANLSYEELSADEARQVASDITQKIDAEQFTKVGQHRENIWRDAWEDVWLAFEKSGYDIAELDPKFMSAAPIIRLNQRFVKALNPRFELAFFALFRNWLFETYLKEIDHVFEFGCGSVFNLAALAQLYPQKKLTGLDWAPASQKIAKALAGHHQMNLVGRRFDFFNPDVSLEIPDNSAVMTFCALEQIGGNFGQILDFILSKKPKIVLHMEPTIEYYDPENTTDALAIRYHKWREYLDGYYTRLRALEVEGKIKILKSKRLYFGSLYHESYSCHVWEPVG